MSRLSTALARFFEGWEEKADEQLRRSRDAMRASDYDGQLKRMQAAAQNLHQLCDDLEQTLRRERRSLGLDVGLDALRQACEITGGELEHVLAAIAEAQEGRQAVTGAELANANLREIRAEIVTRKRRAEKAVQDLVELVETLCQEPPSQGSSGLSPSTRRTEVHLQLPRDDFWNDGDETA
ncbi:hypothetical protein ACWGJ2_02120 [Streptomyces sp. NPDC054796]